MGVASQGIVAAAIVAGAGIPSHLIFYRPMRDGILVVRVLHGARELRSALEDDEGPPITPGAE